MDLEDDERSRLLAFQTLLDASRDASEPKVEMTALRKLCARGIPDHPNHLRPLAYSLLLEALPSDKKSWKQASRQQRQRYYGLVKVFMEELIAAPSPSDPSSSSDTLLTSIAKDIDRLQGRIPFLRSRSSPSRRSPLSPPPKFAPGLIPNAKPGSSVEAVDESSSSSSADDGSSTRLEDRHDPTSERKPRQPVDRILTRRAASLRISLVAEAAHRRSHDSFTSKGKGKEREHGISSPPFASSPEINLSPRITLSPEPEFSTSHPIAASGIAARLQKASSVPMRTPQLSLTLPGDAPSDSHDNSQAPSPITLLSPKPIPTPGSLPFSTSVEGSPIMPGSLPPPDSHVEVLTRLLYIFCRAHPQWGYAPGFVDVIIPLYLMYAGGNVIASPRSKQARKSTLEQTALTPRIGSKYAEEETFWAFAGLMGDFGDIISSGQTTRPDGARDVDWALTRLGRRVRWADVELWSVLRQRNLDPASPLYAYRWITLLLTQDLSYSSIHPLWDFMFSEPPSTAEQQPKIDLLIDVCAALLLLCKDRLIKPPPVSPRKPKSRSPKAGLWDAASSDDESVLTPRVEDPQDAFVRNLQLLRAYPLHEVGGIEAVLQTAFELRQARVVAGLSGDDPDAPGWEEARDAADKPTWATEKLRQAASGASKKLWSGPSEGSTSMSTLSSSGSKLLSKYADTVGKSDAAATLSKASTNWTASAMAKWADASKAASALPSAAKAGAGSNSSDWNGIAGRLWSSVRKGPTSEASYDGSEDGDRYTSAPSTPSKSKRLSQPPKFISPKNTIKYAPGQVPASIAARRDRSDSTTSAVSVASLQDRLANLASSLAPSLTAPAPSTPSLPKPLLLSGSARRASNSSAGHSGRYHSSISSPAPVTPANLDALSPPTMAASRSYESDGTTGGLYRIGSRNSLGRSPHTPTNATADRSGRRTSHGDPIHAAADRLREATSTSNTPTGLPRSPGRHAGLSDKSGASLRRARQSTASSVGSDSDGGIMSPSTTVESSAPPMNRKWSLTDPGTGTNSPDDSDAGSTGRKYSLTDDGASPQLSRRDSSDSQASSVLPLGRTRVIKKKFQKRPTSLRLAESNDHSFSTIPSPILESHPATTSTIVDSPVDAGPISIPTPQIGHLTEEDYEHVYEPAEDSFILLDALEADALALRELRATLCVEIGSGSGIASAFLATLLGPGNAVMMSTDINPFACSATLRTAVANDVSLNPVLGYLLDPLVSRLHNAVDIMVFNPPYVPTDESEMTITQKNRGIGGAWAGGDDGMSVTNILLQQIPDLLAPNGRFYLVAVQQNKPEEIMTKMTALGLQSKTVLKRRAGRELLSVIRFIKPPPPARIAPINIRPTGQRSKLLGPRSRTSNPTSNRISIPSPVLEQHTIPSPKDVQSSIGDFMINGQRSPRNVNGAFPRGVEGGVVGTSVAGNGTSNGAKTHRVRESVAEMADDEDDDQEGYGELLDSYGS